MIDVIFHLFFLTLSKSGSIVASDLSIGLKSPVFVEGQLSKIFSNKVTDVKV